MARHPRLIRRVILWMRTIGSGSMKVVCAGGRVRPVDLESMGVGPVAALCCWAGRPGAPKVRPEALVEKVVTATPPPPEEPRSRPYRSRQFLKSLVLRYSQLARAVHRFGASRTKRQPVVEVSPTVLGDWGSLVESVAVLAATSAGIPGSAEASKVIKALCGSKRPRQLCSLAFSVMYNFYGKVLSVPLKSNLPLLFERVQRIPDMSTTSAKQRTCWLWLSDSPHLWKNHQLLSST